MPRSRKRFSARARRVSSLPLDAVTNMFAERAKHSPDLHLRNISIRYGSSLPHICSAATSAPSTTWWKPAVLTTTATSIACFGVNTGLRRANTGFEICVIPFRQRRPMSQPAENLLIRFAFQTFRGDLDRSKLWKSAFAPAEIAVHHDLAGPGVSPDISVCGSEFF